MPTIPAKQHTAIFTVINLSRGTLGWGLKTPQELDAEIKIWALTLNDHNIPDEHLPELWKRARDLRISRLQNGANCPDFTAELLAACWTGANGLRAKLEVRRVREKKYLPASAESVCPRCRGTFIETVYDSDGKTLGCRPQCRHLELVPGEWLWEQREAAKEEKKTEAAAPPLASDPVRKLSVVPPVAPKPSIVAEAVLSLAEAAALANEHNALVRRIVEDKAAHKHLELVYDEGANVFKLPHRADLTYSVSAMVKKIESYKNILEGEN